MRVYIIGNGLERLQCTLRLVNHSLVLQHTAVVRNVDGRRLRGERGMNALRLGVPLAEGLEGGDGLCGTERVRRSELKGIRMGRTFGKAETRVDTGKILCEGEVNDRCDARHGHSRRPWPLL